MISNHRDITDTSSLIIGQPIGIRDLLVDLGFQSEVAPYTDQQPGYVYRFGNFDLRAVQVTNEHLRPVMQFSGILSTPRSFGAVDFSLPMEVASREQGVALIAHNIGSRFVPSDPTPWLEQGRDWATHLPGRQGLELYGRRPQCHVDALWFRVAVKKLAAAGKMAETSERFSVTFRDGTLMLRLPGQAMPIPATGLPWHQTYECEVRGLADLPRRTSSSGIWISVWQGSLQIGNRKLPVTHVN